MLPQDFQCYLVDRDAAGRVTAGMNTRPVDRLPEGNATLRVQFSSLNYKDALAATGNLGVNRVFPHIPGVDAVGTIVDSGVYELVEGDEVLVTGFDMGANRWGGWSEYVRVPQEWIVPLPAGLTQHEAMILGTAGFTAGLCVDALQRHGVLPQSGPVVVSGASGGVGCMAVAMLAKLGYHVAAVTGKDSAHDFLRELGAREILGRGDVDDRSGRPLLSSRWAGAVDTVGGNILPSILRAVQHSGCVAACGLTAGPELALTVFPFILRAVTLAGIDAAWCDLALRHSVWQRLAGPWKPDRLAEMSRDVLLRDIDAPIREILAGQIRGRVVVRIAAEGCV